MAMIVLVRATSRRIGPAYAARIRALYAGKENAPSRSRLRPDLRLTAAEATAPRITFNLRRSVLGAKATLAVVNRWSRGSKARKSLFAQIAKWDNKLGDRSTCSTV